MARYAPARRETLIRELWTMKEAYTKLTGLGPALDPQSFAISIRDRKLIRTPRGIYGAHEVRFETRQLYDTKGAFPLSVAVQSLEPVELFYARG